MRAEIDAIHPCPAGTETRAQFSVDLFEIFLGHQTERDTALVCNHYYENPPLIQQAYRLDRAIEQLEILRCLDVVPLGCPAV